MNSTESQRRFIESLAKNLTDAEFIAAIGKTGHTGWAATVTVLPGTRNQALCGITKTQASALIDILKNGK